MGKGTRRRGATEKVIEITKTATIQGSGLRTLDSAPRGDEYMVNVLTKNSVNLLDEAVAEARSGNKSEARSLLEEASRVDPSNDKIWLWRASLAETSADAAYSLRQVLRIDPRN